MPLRHFAAAGLLAVALAAAACFLDGCADGGEYTNIAGDWRTIYDDDDGTGIEITTLTDYGEIIFGGFLKAGNYWIESWESTGTWRTSNDTLYEDFGIYGADTLLYKISGGRIAISLCARGICDAATVAEKVDAAAVRSRLGTVRNQDPALFASTVFADLTWHIEGDENETLDFDMMYFLDGERYFGHNLFSDHVWYTMGSRLFLVGMGDGGEVEKTVELEYRVEGAGDAARLFIRPVFEEGGLPREEDIWLPAESDDSGLYWRPYKSKQSKKGSKKRRAVE